MTVSNKAKAAKIEERPEAGWLDVAMGLALIGVVGAAYAYGIWFFAQKGSEIASSMRINAEEDYFPAPSSRRLNDAPVPRPGR